ncbi:unnamed protein product [Mytilus coruscus]|uniref:Uncharacterized protein n=1 Tax=Mytilus coruscus TaxID=42192 RepID=A0A6J8AQM5_MYTCO|nr:unnamed protein product [Mytilus coruscus]
MEMIYTNYGRMALLFCRMSDFIRNPIELPVQRAESEEYIHNIQFGKTIGERNWAWETTCFEKKTVGKELTDKNKRTTTASVWHLHTEKNKQKFLEQLHDIKETALAKANSDNEKLKKKLSILEDDRAKYLTGQDEQIINTRFKRKRLQECWYCHKALVPGQNNGTCCYHQLKPIHLHENRDPKMMIWEFCGQIRKPEGCYQNIHFISPVTILYL